MNSKEKQFELLLRIKCERTTASNKLCEQVITAAREIFCDLKLSITGHPLEINSVRYRARKLADELKNNGVLLSGFGGDVAHKFSIITKMSSKRPIDPRAVRGVDLVVNHGYKQYAAAKECQIFDNNIRSARKKLEYFEAAAAEYKNLL